MLPQGQRDLRQIPSVEQAEEHQFANLLVEEAVFPQIP